MERLPDIAEQVPLAFAEVEAFGELPRNLVRQQEAAAAQLAEADHDPA